MYGGKNEDDKVMIPDHLLQEINQNRLQLLLAIKEEQKKNERKPNIGNRASTPSRGSLVMVKISSTRFVTHNQSC